MNLKKSGARPCWLCYNQQKIFNGKIYKPEKEANMRNIFRQEQLCYETPMLEVLIWENEVFLTLSTDADGVVDNETGATHPEGWF